MNKVDLSLLKEYMNRKGLTQTDVAQRLGVTKQYINSLLSGMRPFGKKQAKLWEDNFGISCSWLLTGEGDMLKSNQSHTSTDANEIAILKEKIRALESILSEKERTIQILLKSREL